MSSYNYECILPIGRGFKMASLNINSLLAHIDELRVFMSNNKLDVLAINETKLDDSISDVELNIYGYDLIRRDRHRNGGGVCFFVKSSINYTIRPDLRLEKLENLCIEIHKTNCKPFLIVTWYRPPSSNIDIFDHYETLVARIDTEGKELYLMGDTNCDLKVNDNYDNHYYNNNSVTLLRINAIYGLTQIIKDKTRITGTTSSLIDHIITNSPDKITFSGVLHLGISDHSLIFAYRKLSSERAIGHKVVKYRKFDSFDATAFLDDLHNQSRDLSISTDNPNEMWDMWKNMFLEIVEKHAPIKKKRVRSKQSPWITSDLKKRIANKNKLKAIAINTKKTEDWENYRHERNLTNNFIRKVKSDYYHSCIESNECNQSGMWQIVNQLTSLKTKSTCINQINSNGVLTNDSDEIAEAMNKHFTSIGPLLSDTIPNTGTCFNQYLKGVTDCTFQLRPVTVVQVSKLLDKLPVKKATGLDDISNRLLKEASNAISNQITDIFNLSIATGTFPKEWKMARVTSIFKKDDRTDPNNYRPISVISAISKVFERLIFDQLYSYLQSNGLLAKTQSGFRAQHSTVTALLEATDSWYQNIDNGDINAVLFLDLKKAFDTVNHSILLQKLSFYGVKNQSLNWFKSYLEDRQQCCYVNGKTSSLRLLTCGVPQGSILGPLLFLIYINDLPSCLPKEATRMYADDTAVTLTGNNPAQIQTLIDCSLADVTTWLNSNKLTLNTTKTDVLFIGSNQRLKNFPKDMTFSVGTKIIKRTSTVKYLGINLDETLSWNIHIEKLIKKISSGLGALRRIKPFIPQKALLLVFNALIQSHFDYCSSVWSNLNIGLSDKLQKLQNRAARILTNLPYETHIDDLLNTIGWNKLHIQRDKQKLTVVFKALHGLTPEYLTEKFKRRNESLEYNLRGSSSNIFLPRPRTNYGKKCIRYSGAKLWNSLPEDLRLTSRLDLFKTKLNEYYLDES